jgi:uncharacterized membrane protein
MAEPPPAAVDRASDKETSRLEAFSDGVLAVIITITAFGLRVPVGGNLRALGDRLPDLLIYVLSFVFIGIYWNNHHHLLRATTRVSGAVMWANLHLLFWLSLIPVVTEWVGASHTSTAPAAAYSTVALAAAMAFQLLVVAIVRTDGRDSKVAKAFASPLKSRLSTLAYTASIGLAFVTPWISYALLAAVAVTWFIPDRRLER